MRIFVLAVVVAAALVGVYLLEGGGDFKPTPVANACLSRERPKSGDLLDPAQRATLAILDGAACDLGMPREQVLLDLLREKNPRGVSDDRVKKAVLAGIKRAEKEKALAKSEATVLEFAVNLGGVSVLLDQLRG
ncbi:MAG: hypothetical protein QOG77_1264 [Solirubrobacteraceae bacterium]|jgi:hypothetical protein|nr:hypothetical protein [Solirubrobacteraceae bacterium]